MQLTVVLVIESEILTLLFLKLSGNLVYLDVKHDKSPSLFPSLYVLQDLSWCE